MVCTWSVRGPHVGTWLVSGRYVVGMWSVSGLYVVGNMVHMSVRGRYVVGKWSVCGR